MTIIERIDANYQEAIKARDMARVGIIRLLKSAIKNEAIKLGHDLSESEVLTVLNREAKTRQDSAEQYKAANRPELAATEEAEINAINHYLPQAMDPAALASEVEAAIAKTGARDSSDMGRVMGELKTRLTNPADISAAAKLAGGRLGQNR